VKRVTDYHGKSEKRKRNPQVFFGVINMDLTCFFINKFARIFACVRIRKSSKARIENRKKTKFFFKRNEKHQ